MHVVLDRVPLRAKGMTPAEIPLQRVAGNGCARRPPVRCGRFHAVCAKWDVTATEIGEVTDTERLVITWHDEVVVDVPPRTVAHEGPVYNRPVTRPSDQDPCRSRFAAAPGAFGSP